MDDKDNKIEINKKTDLLKLSISQIMNTKVYNFKGSYFNQLYEEALNLEKTKGENSNFSLKNISEIEFEVKYETEFGQRIVITGSQPNLGNWDPQNGLALNWNEGNLWRSKISPSDYFEFKLVLFEHNKVKSWEGGENRIYDMKTVKSHLINAESTGEKLSFKMNSMTFILHKNSNVLTMILEWIH